MEGWQTMALLTLFAWVGLIWRTAREHNDRAWLAWFSTELRRHRGLEKLLHPHVRKHVIGCSVGVAIVFVGIFIAEQGIIGSLCAEIVKGIGLIPILRHVEPLVDIVLEA